MCIIYNDLDNPKTRIALIKKGIPEVEIGKAYQTIRGRIIVQ